jgi:hypothetical protein
MAHIKIMSDYTGVQNPNVLHVMLDDQGDIHIWTYIPKENKDNNESSIRLAQSGSRHKSMNSVNIWKAFQALVKAYEEELNDPHCHPALKNLNGR